MHSQHSQHTPQHVCWTSAAPTCCACMPNSRVCRCLLKASPAEKRTQSPAQSAKHTGCWISAACTCSVCGLKERAPVNHAPCMKARSHQDSQRIPQRTHMPAQPVHAAYMFICVLSTAAARAHTCAPCADMRAPYRPCQRVLAYVKLTGFAG